MGKTQKQLASELGVDQTAISQWERGTSKPGTAQLIVFLNLAATESERNPILAALVEEGAVPSEIALALLISSFDDEAKS